MNTAIKNRQLMDKRIPPGFTLVKQE